MNTLPEKRCCRCQLTMPLGYFQPRTDRPGHHYTACRDCRNLVRRKAARKPVAFSAFGRPYVPNADFEPNRMGEPDWTVPMRWSV